MLIILLVLAVLLAVTAVIFPDNSEQVLDQYCTMECQERKTNADAHCC